MSGSGDVLLWIFNTAFCEHQVDEPSEFSALDTLVRVEHSDFIVEVDEDADADAFVVKRGCRSQLKKSSAFLTFSPVVVDVLLALLVDLANFEEEAWGVMGR